ncbi:unnamed protein product [Cyprideis torosa]|uniref:PiggyBac transposable element-derived protein domain-containing protein n=1 Tax=Cyprideis torosa TaxID=163714 RepID=A0A7R8WGS4_9CRUS|nr:unnamed protein product [Cyprideis torosa]CAG0892949.1 unnamed protein product [Cyprideis torosa]
MPKDQEVLVRRNHGTNDCSINAQRSVLQHPFPLDVAFTEEIKSQDKLWKIRPMLDIVRNACMSLPTCAVVSIDEQIIPYHGKKIPCRVLIKNKPNPIGLKNYVMATPDGLVLDFKVYQGANTFQNIPEDVKACGHGATVLYDLSKSLRKGSQVFADRYFNSEKAFDILTERGIYCTGTLQKNTLPSALKRTKRPPREEFFSSDTDMKKRGRGSWEVAVRKDGAMNCIKWMDSKPVVLLSTAVKPEQDPGIVRRWDKATKDFVNVQRPNIVAEYNAKMGGVDLIDRMIAYYRQAGRTNIWIARVVFHFLDFACAQAWVLMRKGLLKNGTRKKDIPPSDDFKEQISRRGRRDFVVIHVPLSSSEDMPYQPIGKREMGGVNFVSALGFHMWATHIFKAVIRKSNRDQWEEAFMDAEELPLQLQNGDKKFIHQTSRKTPIFGLVISMKSIRGIFQSKAHLSTGTFGGAVLTSQSSQVSFGVQGAKRDFRRMTEVYLLSAKLISLLGPLEELSSPVSRPKFPSVYRALSGIRRLTDVPGGSVKRVDRQSIRRCLKVFFKL